MVVHVVNVNLHLYYKMEHAKLLALMVIIKINKINAKNVQMVVNNVLIQLQTV